ncbi:MAG: LPS-assembly protein LptD [Janthinobacterium lividum]
MSYKSPRPTAVYKSLRKLPRLSPLAIAISLCTTGAPVAAFAQLSGAAAQPVTLDGRWGFSLAPQIGEHPGASGQPTAHFGLGDRASGVSGLDTTLDGHAELRSPGNVIKGDKIHYDEDTDVADAYGNVVIVDHGNAFYGPRGQMHVQANSGYLLSPTYRFGATGGTGKAERIDVIDSERARVTNGTYTACQCADPSWYIRASRFDIDNGDGSGTARNAVLMFEGLPLFASPYMTFPLNDDRQSGVLPPTFSVNSTTGVDVTVPYYVNIAPNRDLTLYPRFMSQRGVQLGAEFRYLSPTYSGTITLADLPRDLETHTNRYEIAIQHQQNLGNGFGAYINYNRVSDSRYPEDLSTNNLLTTGIQSLFTQEAGITYNNGPWSVLAREERWQTLPPSTAPYAREPQLNVKYQRYEVGGFDFGAEADYSRFTITTADTIEGQRVYLNPYVSYPIVAPGYFVVPKVQWHLAAYDLTNIPDGTVGQNKTPTVSIPTLSFDTGLVFERSVRLFGTDYIQTLEPRLYYVYTPYRDQSQLPAFDTTESDFGLAEIFTTNTFVGNDRVADANRLTAALTTRFLNAASGDERARFVIAQQYYFQNQRVTVPGQTLADTGRSDILLGGSLMIGEGFATQNAIQYDAGSGRLIRSNVGFAWSPEDRKVLNVAYRFTANNTTLGYEPLKQVLLSVEWPLTRRLYGIGRINYALDSHRLVDGLLGFQYDADCWTLGFAVQHYANGVDSSSQTSTGMRYLAQLELKGFSHVDNGLVAAFRASVPGYAPPPPPAPPLSRFSDYE